MNAKDILIEVLTQEIELLEKWIATSQTGGWSTHLVAPMRNRISELLSIYFDASKQK